MFVDKAKIKIKAGNGGNGAVAFHREKYVASGVPTVVTAVKAAISSSRLTLTFQLLQISVTKENTQPKAVRTVQVQERTAKKVRTL